MTTHTCQITNNSGKDVVVISATDFSTNADNNAPKFVYQQTLTILKLATGGTVLKNGSTDSVVLDETTPSGAAITIFELIIAEVSNLAPIATVVEMTFAIKPITLTPDDATKMAQALAFNQEISTFPSSKLAKDFTTIIKEDKILKDMEADVVQFFQGTTSYTSVDFPAYMAASTYISTFLPQWVDGTDVPYLPAQTNPNTPQVYAHTEYSYWLYSSTDLGGDSNGATSASCSGRVTFGVGTVSPPAGQSYTNNYPLTLTGDPTDCNCGIKAYLTQEYFQIPTGSGTSLVYNNGQLVDNVDNPTICLQTGFALKSTFTGNISDTAVWPIVTGTMGGKKVIGVPMRPEDAWDKFTNYWTTMTFEKFVQLFLTIMGVLMALDFIKTKLAGKERAADKATADNDGGDLTPEQQQAVEAAGPAVEAEAEIQANDTAKRMNDPDLTVPDEASLPTVQGGLPDQIQEVNNNANFDSANKTLATDEATVEQMAAISDDQNVQNAGGAIDQMQTDLNQPDNTNFKTVAQDALNVKEANDDWVHDNNNLGQVVEDTVANAEKAAAQEAAIEQQTEQDNTNVEEGNAPGEDALEVAGDGGG